MNTMAKFRLIEGRAVPEMQVMLMKGVAKLLKIEAYITVQRIPALLLLSS